MPVYIIGYDLHRTSSTQRAHDNETLKAAIKSLYPDNLYRLDSTWLVYTSKDNAASIKSKLKTKFTFKSEDKLFIAKITHDNTTIGFEQPEDDDWLSESV